MRSNGPPPKPPGSGRPRPLESEVHAIQLALSGHIPIWDIRPQQERCGLPGFIPGSRCVPMEPTTVHAIPWESLLTQHRVIALTCLSGRRSEAVVSLLRAQGTQGVIHLTGGILAWQAEGFPLCIPEPVEPEEYRTVATLRQLPRAVLSCFVAESVQSQTSFIAGGLVDPKRLVSDAFEQSGALTSFDGARDALDLLAENARRLGHPIEHIASNLNSMRATVRRIEIADAHPTAEEHSTPGAHLFSM